MKAAIRAGYIDVSRSAGAETYARGSRDYTGFIGEVGPGAPLALKYPPRADL